LSAPRDAPRFIKATAMGAITCKGPLVGMCRQTLSRRGVEARHAVSTTFEAMNETIKASSTRKSNGWAPTLEYQNGGRVIGQQRCDSMREAIGEASDLIRCMSEYPEAFRNNHPAPNQLIDLSDNQ